MVKRDSNFNPLGSSRGLRRRSSGVADWSAANATILRDTISKAAIVGGALRFGYSRDGGAYAIGVYGDGEPYTEFIRPGEDIDAILLDIQQLFEDIGDDIRPDRKSQKGAKSAPPGDIK